MSDLARIRAILATTPLRWTQLTESLPDDLLRQRPAPSEWSALECLQHIVDTEAIFPTRLLALRDEQDIPAFNPDEEGTQGSNQQSPSALAETFAQMRTANLAVLAEVNESMFQRSGTHSELGVVTLGQLAHEWAAHDLDHTIQAERALMQPFIRGCGAWQVYFTANRIEPEA